MDDSSKNNELNLIGLFLTAFLLLGGVLLIADPAIQPAFLSQWIANSEFGVWGQLAGLVMAIAGILRVYRLAKS